MIPRSKLAAAVVLPETSILESVKSIETGGIQAALVCRRAGERLLGVATNSDIRRGILRGISLQANRQNRVMNPKPAVRGPSASREEALRGDGQAHAGPVARD